VRVAQMAVPVLVSRVEQILRAYVVASRQAGEFPLPRYRREEAGFILKELYALELSEVVGRVLFDPATPLAAVPSSSGAASSSAAAGAAGANTPPAEFALMSAPSSGAAKSMSSGASKSGASAHHKPGHARTGSTTAPGATGAGRKAHLLKLFPVLCDCIT
jgi:hypothetical protein